MYTNIVCSNFRTLSLHQGPYSFVEAAMEGDKHRESNVDEQRHDHDWVTPSFQPIGRCVRIISGSRCIKLVFAFSFFLSMSTLDDAASSKSSSLPNGASPATEDMSDEITSRYEGLAMGEKENK